MLLPDLSKLALVVGYKRKVPDSDCEPCLREVPAQKRPTPAHKILVRSIRILPRPDDALSIYAIWTEALESFASFALDPFEPITDEVFEQNLHEWVRTKLKLPEGPFEFNSVMMFMGYYIALSIMAINASGPPDAPWGGPITYKRNYPVERSIVIWNAILAAGRHKAVRAVLNRLCPGVPQHPWFTIDDDKSRKKGTYPFIDTMGGIMDMTSQIEPTHSRQLVIATRDGEFMGHVFVSYANKPYNGIKGLMPYGIQRSAFYLPGTCAPPSEASGFVDALFGRVRQIAYENRITHIFTWPLEKMKGRFVNMGYTVVEKGSKVGALLENLKSAVYSIYGVGTVTTGYILGRELQSWDFVLLAL